MRRPEFYPAAAFFCWFEIALWTKWGMHVRRPTDNGNTVVFNVGYSGRCLTISISLVIFCGCLSPPPRLQDAEKIQEFHEQCATLTFAQSR